MGFGLDTSVKAKHDLACWNILEINEGNQNGNLRLSQFTQKNADSPP